MRKTGRVEIKTSCEVKVVNAVDDQGFQIATSLGYFQAASVVAGCNWRFIHSQLRAQALGMILPSNLVIMFILLAGLVPFTFSDSFKDITTRLSGNAVDATLSNSLNSFTEALLFTHRGLSGPSALQLSNYWDIGKF